MKQIVLIVGHYKNGGVSMRATNLANEFGRRGYPVTILVTKDIGEKIFFELHKNVKLVSLSQFIKENCANSIIINETIKQEQQIRNKKRIRYISRFIPKWDRKLEMQIRQIRLGGSIRKYLLFNADAILIPFGLAYYEQTIYAAKELNCKIIYAERNAPQLELPKDKVRAEQLLEILSEADGAVFQTDDEKVFYKDYIDKNTAVIHNPIKKNLPKPHQGERRKVIANYCRIAPQKNLKLLIDAFAKLHEEFSEYILEIYGNAVEDSEERLRDELKAYIETIGLKGYVYILPPAADVHWKVRDCAMFVSSSDFEGLSNSMIEAMAIGMPCVCTDCLGGGAREMIVHEENGILVPMNDVEALYQGMRRMIVEPELMQRCSNNAAKIVEEMSVEKIADRWIEVINNA